MTSQPTPVTHPPLQAVFDRYHASWESRDPDRIAALHSEDTVFHLHDGSPSVTGRQALREHCAGVFRKYQFSLTSRRILFGADHWTFEWLMTVPLQDTHGKPFEAHIEMLDIVTVNRAGEVVRKDVYMNGAQAQASFARAGVSIDGGIRY